MADRMTLEVDRTNLETEQAYRELACEDRFGQISVSDDALVRQVGEDGAWVTVQYWISAPQMREYLRRQPHQREGGM